MPNPSEIERKTPETRYEYAAVVERVIDGDTLAVVLDLGFDVRVRQTLRLAGVNTPELRGATYEQGNLARLYVLGCCPPGAAVLVRTFKDRKEKYGRYLAEVFYGAAQSLNAELLARGLAAPTPDSWR